MNRLSCGDRAKKAGERSGGGGGGEGEGVGKEEGKACYVIPQ